MERTHKSTMQNHNTQLSHYTQICKQCSSGYKKTPGRSALCSVTHPKKTNPTDILRGSTLPVASTPLQGEAEYPVFNWQLSQRPLCLQLPSPCSNRHTVFNRLPKMGFRDALTQHSSQCLRRVPIIWGWGWSTNMRCQHSPEKLGVPAAQPGNHAGLGQKEEKTDWTCWLGLV